MFRYKDGLQARSRRERRRIGADFGDRFSLGSDTARQLTPDAAGRMENALLSRG